MEVEASGSNVAGKTSADYYFDSYSHFGIHEEMLKDDVRTRSYQKSIYQNKHLFEGKIVLDVGCGTGILSLFAAKAGAKHVYGIDFSGIIEQAQEIVRDNGYEGKVTLIRGKVEEVTLPVDKVDVIISEWMGYFLFYESMLDTVLYARDKWLVPGGLIFPDKAQLFITGIEDADYKEEKINFWDSVYGFNMKAVKKLVTIEPLVDTCPAESICTDPSSLLLEVDITTMKKEDAAFNASFSLTAARDDYCHALVVYFDIFFSCCHKPIHFSTGPRAKYTHWKQTIFYLDDVLVMKKGEVLRGTLSSKPNEKNPRDLDIQLTYEFNGSNCQASGSQFFRLR
eukprot:TRINITY_DN5671_c0_g1_i1.p1 TRINITY_DN5671_c0_g1~~TRINITY_DN5671_c0_g1_i1.p1  ORF type:complete len:339 (+),score=89.23 TRINITY_DN5671_c0_g1_i1:69-1085(+)